DAVDGGVGRTGHLRVGVRGDVGKRRVVGREFGLVTVPARRVGADGDSVGRRVVDRVPVRGLGLLDGVVREWQVVDAHGPNGAGRYGAGRDRIPVRTDRELGPG